MKYLHPRFTDGDWIDSQFNREEMDAFGKPAPEFVPIPLIRYLDRRKPKPSFEDYCLFRVAIEASYAIQFKHNKKGVVIPFRKL